MAYQVKGWENFQHYKHRNPPWIRLYRSILDNRDFHETSPASAKMLVQFWILASENDGLLPDAPAIAFRLRCKEKDVLDAFSELYKRGFIELQGASATIATRQQDASKVHAECKQHAPSESEAETDNSEAETETDASPSSRVKTHPGFKTFYEAYPVKKGIGKAREKWNSKKPDLAKCLKAIEQQKLSEEWQRGFIKDPATWLNQECWDDVVAPRKVDGPGKRMDAAPDDLLTYQSGSADPDGVEVFE